MEWILSNGRQISETTGHYATQAYHIAAGYAGICYKHIANLANNGVDLLWNGMSKASQMQQNIRIEHLYMVIASIIPLLIVYYAIKKCCLRHNKADYSKLAKQIALIQHSKMHVPRTLLSNTGMKNEIMSKYLSSLYFFN